VPRKHLVNPFNRWLASISRANDGESRYRYACARCGPAAWGHLVIVYARCAQPRGASVGEVADVQLWHPRPTLHVSPQRLTLALRATEEPVTVAVTGEALRRFKWPTENSIIWKRSDVSAIVVTRYKDTRLPIIIKITEEFRR
jgi:hypothetical protein